MVCGSFAGLGTLGEAVDESDDVLVVVVASASKTNDCESEREAILIELVGGRCRCVSSGLSLG